MPPRSRRPGGAAAGGEQQRAQGDGSRAHPAGQAEWHGRSIQGPATAGVAVAGNEILVGMHGDPTPYAELVLDAVARIPRGRVMSYGDVAEYVADECEARRLRRGGPRQVGHVMALWGGGVPWWRVIRADGSPPVCDVDTALAHYRAEGTPLRSGGVRVDTAVARWDGR